MHGILDSAAESWSGCGLDGRQSRTRTPSIKIPSKIPPYVSASCVKKVVVQFDVQAGDDTPTSATKPHIIAIIQGSMHQPHRPYNNEQLHNNGADNRVAFTPSLLATCAVN